MSHPWAQGDAAQQTEEQAAEARIRLSLDAIIYELQQRHTEVDEVLGVLGSVTCTVIKTAYQREDHDDIVRAFYRSMRRVMKLPKRRK